MHKLKVGDKEMPLAYTTWTANEFHRLTAINLYDAAGISMVFKNEDLTPPDFEVIVKLAYCALASAVMPEDAADDWKPPFTWKGIMNKFSFSDMPAIYDALLSAYFGRSVEELSAELEKNSGAPVNAGQ